MVGYDLKGPQTFLAPRIDRRERCATPCMARADNDHVKFDIKWKFACNTIMFIGHLCVVSCDYRGGGPPSFRFSISGFGFLPSDEVYVICMDMYDPGYSDWKRLGR